MVYLVGVSNPHIAIGTSALAVAVNAATGLFSHARTGTVKWRCASLYAGAGVAGAFAGSTAGKAFDGQQLLFLFALVMAVIGIMMLRSRGETAAIPTRNARERTRQRWPDTVLARAYSRDFLALEAVF